MLTAEQVHANNPGSRMFEAGDITLVIRQPFQQEWDLSVDMRRRDLHEGRQCLRGAILYPSRDAVASLLKRKPKLADTIDDLIVNMIAPVSGPLTDSDKYPDAKMVPCDGVMYHLSYADEKVYYKLEDGSRVSYSAAATHYVKACLLEPDAIAFDNANNAKPGLKHVLAAHLTNMAGAEIKFTEKK